MTTVALPQLEGAALLTHSRRQCFKKCPRKHFYAYELGIRPERSATPLRMGAAIHLGLDRFGKGDPISLAIATAVAGYEEAPPWADDDEKLAEWMTEREKVAELLAGYFWRWSDDLTIAAVVESEHVFTLPIPNPDTGKTTPVFSRAGKRDKIVRLEDGRMAVMEHKTCSEDLSPDSDYWRRLRIDEQISEYVVTARLEGHDVSTVVYDVIRKPSIAPKIVDRKSGRRETPQEYGARLRTDIRERPEFYFARREIPRLDADLLEHAAELWQIQQTIREAQKSGRWFRNTGACLMMGRCEYLDICHQGLDVASGTLPSGFRRVTNIHEELAEEAA